MFDLDGFLSLLDEIEEKRRNSAVPMFRQSLENDSVGVRLRQKPGPMPRFGDALASGKPRTGGKPVAGFAPIAAFEDERRKRRGGGGGRAGRAGTSTVSPARAKPGSGEAITPARPQIRAAIALGSQPAVVKLVSFATGRSRIVALLNYQSRAGKVLVEDEAGLTQDGNAWVQAIADDWSEEDGRQPSKDVLRISVMVPVWLLSLPPNMARGLRILSLRRSSPRRAGRLKSEGRRRPSAKASVSAS